MTPEVGGNVATPWHLANVKTPKLNTIFDWLYQGVAVPQLFISSTDPSSSSEKYSIVEGKNFISVSKNVSVFSVFGKFATGTAVCEYSSFIRIIELLAQIMHWTDVRIAELIGLVSRLPHYAICFPSIYPSIPRPD